MPFGTQLSPLFIMSSLGDLSMIRKRRIVDLEGPGKATQIFLPARPSIAADCRRPDDYPALEDLDLYAQPWNPIRSRGPVQALALAPALCSRIGMRSASSCCKRVSPINGRVLLTNKLLYVRSQRSLCILIATDRRARPAGLTTIGAIMQRNSALRHRP